MEKEDFQNPFILYNRESRGKEISRNVIQENFPKMKEISFLIRWGSPNICSMDEIDPHQGTSSEMLVLWGRP